MADQKRSKFASVFLNNFYRFNKIILALGFINLLELVSEMKKFLIGILIVCMSLVDAVAASRSDNVVTRGKTENVTLNKTVRSIMSRKPVRATVSPRLAKPVNVLTPRPTSAPLGQERDLSSLDLTTGDSDTGIW